MLIFIIIIRKVTLKTIDDSVDYLKKFIHKA